MLLIAAIGSGMYTLKFNQNQEYFFLPTYQKHDLPSPSPSSSKLFSAVYGPCQQTAEHQTVLTGWLR